MSEQETTILGNPAKPTGTAGEEMLDRMNESHYEVTGWALDFFHFRNNDIALDIGCGGGRTLSRLSSRISDGKITGVDYSPVSVEKSISYNQRDIDSGKMRVLEGSVEELPFEDHTFDKIVTVESFYFWPNPIKDLKEVRRVLKKDGTFLLVADIYEREDLTDEVRENIARYNMNNPTEEEFVKLFAAAGFQEIIVHLKENTTWICVEGRK